MTDDKLLRVSCIVRQPFLWDLLRSLEAHKVGNVEVRPVVPLLALPPPAGSNGKGTGRGRGNVRTPMYGNVQPLVRAAMRLKEKRRIPELAKEIGAKKQSTYSAVAVLLSEGVVKRLGVGVYMRTKPDRVAQP